MSETLYRKYRPQKFSEVIGQPHIVQTLSNSIKNNRIGHAYLFTGPRGTGKTTLARIFAKAVNCANLSSEERAADKLSIRRSSAKADINESKYYEPCLVCENCKNIQDGRSLDIIEIDAASNTGVDNIRELRETVKLPPTRAKYKVYIIDEVHMLSSGAFNALLKTLEEPPAHVIFILATTEIHKVPETIISRCQRFDFARLSLDNIIKKLSSIAESEKVEIEKDALEMIAISAEGGMRDAESTLAQVISLEDKKITAKEVGEILGTTDHQNIEEMAVLLLGKNISEALALVNRLASEGHDLEIFNKSFLNYLRQILILSVDEKLSAALSLELTSEQIEKAKKVSKNNTGEILKILESFSEIQNKIRSSFIPQLPLEMAIVKIGNYKSEVAKIEPSSIQQPAAAIHKEAENIKPEEKKPVAEQPKELSAEEVPAAKQFSNVSLEDVLDKWKNIIREIKPFNHSLSAFLINCQPAEVKNGFLIIATKYKFYKDKLNEHQNKLTIEKVLANILGSDIKVKFLSEDEAGVKIKTNPLAPKDSSSSPTSKSNSPKETGSLLNDALEMMGGKIVEE
jgi:DNA polymerase-3 subunit gamma/tau